MNEPITTFGWACRQLTRHPGTAWLTGIAIFALVAVSAAVLLLAEAFSTTASQVLAGAPTHVVRRVGVLGWQPVVIETAVKAAESVVGVTEVRPRVWGLARCGQRTVTVVGVFDPARLERQGVTTVPRPGGAVVGPGVNLEAESEGKLTLVGPDGELELELLTRLGDDSAMALHDVVLLHVDDARGLLGLAAGMASDLAVSVFHDAEQDAITADLAAAFDGPVRITTRREAIGAAVAAFARQGSLRMLLLVPASLALCLLLVVALRRGRDARRELGLYKALGWSTADLVRLQMFAAAAVALPAVLLGLAFAWTFVFWPEQREVVAWLVAWPGRAPALSLTPGAGLQVTLGVAGAVLVPWLLAALLPALRSAAIDPQELMRGGRT